MSFILDALKKSESERQRQHAPGIASIPESGRQESPARWPWVVGGLLVINIAALSFLLLKPDSATSPSPAAVDESQLMEPPATSSAGSRATPQTAPSRAAEPAAQTVSAPAVPQPVADSVIPEAAARQPTYTAGLPTLRDLRAAGQIQLPDMHLDIHVYSGQPDDRFVFVNMSKYKEGATLKEGPQVSEITADGVVLDYFGTRFLLPRE